MLTFFLSAISSISVEIRLRKKKKLLQVFFFVLILGPHLNLRVTCEFTTTARRVN